MYFECESQLVSEDGFKFPEVPWSLKYCVQAHITPENRSRKNGISFIAGQQTGGDRGGPRWEGGWISLVENYSKRALTVSDDKLSAIAGVARVIAEETGDRYFAGVWARHLTQDLYWRVYTQEELFAPNPNSGGVNNLPVRGKLFGKATRPANYRAPTWSWASLDAPVRFIPLSYQNLVARPRSCVVSPAGKDQFARVSSARLEIDAPIYEIHPCKPSVKWTRHGIPVSINLGDERGTCVGAVHLDFEEESLEFPCYAIFLDPANAPIIKSQHREPFRDHQNNTHKDRLVPKRILCTTDLGKSMRQTTRGGVIVWLRTRQPESAGDYVQISEEEFEEFRKHSGAKEGWETSFIDESQHVVRIGVGMFVKELKKGKPDAEEGEKDKAPRKYDPAVDGELKLEDIVHGEGDQSWGGVTKDDAKIPVAIF